MSATYSDFFPRQEPRSHTNRAAGVGHIDGLTIVIVRIDLDRRMHLRGGRPTIMSGWSKPSRCNSAAT